MPLKSSTGETEEGRAEFEGILVYTVKIQGSYEYRVRSCLTNKQKNNNPSKEYSKIVSGKSPC